MRCLNCNKDFIPTGTAQKFCSAKCRKTYHSTQAKERNKQFMQDTCWHCGKAYTKTSGNQKYCSPECKETARKQTYTAYNNRVSRGLIDTELFYGIQGLANAIIKQAADDYRRSLRGLTALGSFKSAEYTLMECERFFRSSWYSMLTELNPEWLIQKLKEDIDTRGKLW